MDLSLSYEWVAPRIMVSALVQLPFPFHQILDLGLRTWTWLDVSVARLRVEEGSHVQCTVKILFVG